MSHGPFSCKGRIMVRLGEDAPIEAFRPPAGEKLRTADIRNYRKHFEDSGAGWTVWVEYQMHSRDLLSPRPKVHVPRDPNPTIKEARARSLAEAVQVAGSIQAVFAP
jgi:hypothetical protein